MNTAAPRPPRHLALARIARFAGAALSASAVCLALGAMPATAAPSRSQSTADCPSSLRSVVGGTRDEASGGRDDGVAGPDKRYESGEVLVRLAPGAKRSALNCILRELGAGLIAGGPGARGLGGLDGLAVLQLPPGRSVRRTEALLEASRYRKLIRSAQPNHVLSESQTAEPRTWDPNDPLFPWQWGLSNKQRVAKPFFPGGPVLMPGGLATDQAEVAFPDSMRLPQAWAATKKNSFANVFRSYVQVAIIDDGLDLHEDLAALTSDTKSARVEPASFDKQQFVLSADANDFTRQSFKLNSGLGNSCPISRTATEAEMQSLLARRASVLCNRTTNSVRSWLVTVRGTSGSFTLNDGAGNTVTVDVDRFKAQGFSLAEWERQLIAGSAVFARLFNAGTFATMSVPDTDDCLEVDDCVRFVIAVDDPGATPTVGDTQRLFLRPGAGGPTGRVSITAQDARVTRTGQKVSVTYTKGIQASGLFTADPASAINSVEGQASGGYRIARPAGDVGARKWVGKYRPDASNHGNLVAGVIAGTPGNGIGITGVVGPHAKVKVSMIAAPGNSAALVVAIEYAAVTIGAKVVNISRGGLYRDGEVPTALVDPTQEDPRDADMGQEAMADYPGTLFVLAAGNEATNVVDPAPRHVPANRYGQRQATEAMCAPKGMGIKTHWRNRPGTRDGATDTRRAVEKGGALAQLKMPDGTYDRGNILCVAAAAPGSAGATRRLADFSSWGKDIVDVAAPGEQIVTTTDTNGGYAVVNGTSFAAPMVAGVAAMVFWMNKGMDASLVKCAILSSATSAPLDPPDYSAWPFRNYPASGGRPLTVNGTVVATEALDVATRLTGRGSKPGTRRNADGVTEYTDPPTTCVQRRDRLWFPTDKGGEWRGSGAWINTTSFELDALRPVTAPPPAPAPQPGPAP